METPIYQLYREYFREMESNFDEAKLDAALAAEQKILNLLRCIFHEDVKDSIMYEMHCSKCTQKSWPYRKKNTMNARYLQFLEEHSGYEDDDE